MTMRAIVLTDARQARDFADVDERFRLGQAEIHDGEEAMAPSQNLRLAIVLREERDGFLKCGWSMILE